MSSFSLEARITISEANSMPGRAQVQARQHVAPQRAHAAVRVADAGAEEDVEDAREHRVADVAVQPRHRARVDLVHPVAHDELGALVEVLDEARDLVEVVREVGVAHHDVAAAGGGEAGQVGAAVAAARLVDDARAGGGRELRAAVLGRVVGDDDLAGDAVLGQHGQGGGDAALDVGLFVEARDHDRDDELLRRRRRRGGRAREVRAEVCSWQGRDGLSRNRPTRQEPLSRAESRQPG